MTDSQLPEVVTLHTESIHDDPAGNPNLMSVESFTMLRDAIEKVGFIQPVLVRQRGEDDYEIVDGHHRMKAARELGLPLVTAVLWDGTDEMRRAVQIGMNRLRGELDLSQVAVIAANLLDEGMDMADMTIMGFSEIELDALMKSLKTDEIDTGPMDGGEAPPPEDTTTRIFELTLTFDTAAQLKEARKGLRKAAGKGRELGEGLIVLLGKQE